MSRFGLAATALLIAVVPTSACSVPVFRYALERWQPARYDLVVYHRGPLNAADQLTLAKIEAASRTANVRFIDADLDVQVEPDLRAVWDRDGSGADLPRLVLRYPESGPAVASARIGPLTEDAARWFDSPARRQMFERLTAGHAGVVILLRSGETAVDNAARDLLKTELPRIAGRIKLPKPTEDGPQVESTLPLWIDFPIVEVVRTPDEESLVDLLLGSEDGLTDVRGPIAFPVFGRGRVLCSLHGKNLITATELQKSLEFLCGACSCQVKELNPGIDLLMAANWDRVFAAELGPTPRLVGAVHGPAWAETRPTPTFENPAAEQRPGPPTGVSAADQTYGNQVGRSRPTWLRPGIILAAAMVLLTGLWALHTRRGQSGGSQS